MKSSEEQLVNAALLRQYGIGNLMKLFIIELMLDEDSEAVRLKRIEGNSWESERRKELLQIQYSFQADRKRGIRSILN